MANGELALNRESRPVADTEPAAAQEMSDELHELLTIDEVAALLKVSKSWVYEHTRKRGTPRSGRLPHVKIGKYVRFEPRAVREFLARLTKIA
jgi:excisionase family DNA binding protein